MIKNQYKVNELNTINAKDLQKNEFHPIRISISTSQEIFQLAAHLKNSAIKHISLEFQDWHSDDALEFLNSCKALINVLGQNVKLTSLKIENFLNSVALYNLNLNSNDLLDLHKEIQRFFKLNYSLKMLHIDDDKLSDLFHHYFYEAALSHPNLVVIKTKNISNNTYIPDQLDIKVKRLQQAMDKNELNDDVCDAFLVLNQASNPEFAQIGEINLKSALSYFDKKQLDEEASTFLIINKIEENLNCNSTHSESSLEEDDFELVQERYEPVLMKSSNISNPIASSTISDSTDENVMETSKADDWQILDH